MPTFYDDYRMFGLPTDASRALIRRRYLQLVRACHPDRFFNNTQARIEAEERMKAINRTYARIVRAPLRHMRTKRRSNATSPSPTPTAVNKPRRTSTVRLDPITREALIRALQQPSPVDYLFEVLPKVFFITLLLAISLMSLSSLYGQICLPLSIIALFIWCRPPLRSWLDDSAALHKRGLWSDKRSRS